MVGCEVGMSQEVSSKNVLFDVSHRNWKIDSAIREVDLNSVHTVTFDTGAVGCLQMI